MLPLKYRLKKRTAFNATYKTGKSFHKDGVTVFCGRIKKTEIATKFGFVVSKKIHKRAVKRNRIRRLMRESVRLYIKNHNGNEFDTKFMSLVFVASSRLLDKDFQYIDNCVNKIMSKIMND